MLRKILDKIAPLFEKGGSLHILYPAYEAWDTFLYTPKTTTAGSVQVRDSLCMKRTMTTVMIALVPCILMGMYNTGYQALKVIEDRGFMEMPAEVRVAEGPLGAEKKVSSSGESGTELEKSGTGSEKSGTESGAAPNTENEKKPAAVPNAGIEGQTAISVGGDFFPETFSIWKWQPYVMGKYVACYDYLAQGIHSQQGDSCGCLKWCVDQLGSGVSAQNVLSCFFLGALYFFPIYIVTFAVGILWELLFAMVRGHEINEGFFVTSLLLPLTLPATIPLWQVAVAITFGVVIAKELFGGTGRNFLNPALAARAFLFFTFPTFMAGDSMWVAVDGVTAATPLGAALTDGMSGIESMALASGRTSMQYWFDAFLGFIPGSIGETSALCCLLGACLLVYTGIGSWRIMGSLLAGSMLTGFFFYFLYAAGYVDIPVYGVYPHWHFVLGGLAFGMVFMATDPVTGSMTHIGQYIYGFLIGFMILLVRVVNPAYPEGVMLAILFGNIMAPLVDYFVIAANIRRRALRDVQ